MAFNQKVEEVQREHEREMAAVQSRRKRIVAHADVLQQEMLAAFEGLESLIQSGRAQVGWGGGGAAEEGGGRGGKGKAPEGWRGEGGGVEKPGMKLQRLSGAGPAHASI